MSAAHTPYPASWDGAQRQRFAPLSKLLGVDGLFDAFSMVHVSGTNGKGSICAYLAQICRTAGLKTGLFISPHLYHETERVQVNGQAIPPEVFQHYMDQAYAASSGVKLFEAYLYIALRYFAQEGVDIAVIETGIGGSMDASSVIAPVLCVTGTIGYDHESVLGHEIQRIAAQKAGINKPGVPAVLYPTAHEEARQAYRAACARIGAPLTDLHGLRLVPLHSDLHGQTFDFAWQGGEMRRVQIAMLGAHQMQNAATAAVAAYKLAEAGFPIREADIRTGLRDTRWPGRMEVRPGDVTLLIDGAHNKEGAQALARACAQLIAGRPAVLLTAVMGDKDVLDVVQALAPIAQKVVCTCADPRRGLGAKDLAALYGANAVAEDDPGAALARAQALCPKGGVIVIAGSLYLPGALGLG